MADNDVKYRQIVVLRVVVQRTAHRSTQQWPDLKPRQQLSCAKDASLALQIDAGEAAAFDDPHQRSRETFHNLALALAWSAGAMTEFVNR